jgi:hypothetical protein
MVECRYCPKTFRDHTSVYNHVERSHPFRCYNCKMAFRNYHTWKQHKKSGHNSLSGGISKIRIVRQRGYKILAPYKEKGGAIWCYTCRDWSKGCKRMGHETRYIVFG